MNILILGAGGFVGMNLSKALSARGHKVFAADKVLSDSVPYQFDLCDKRSIRELMLLSSPDAILLLAGMSSVGFSWKDPVSTFDCNVTGALRVFESHLELAPEARFIFAGSAEEYGKGEFGKSFTEDSPCFPGNPYAMSKYAAAETLNMLAEKYQTSFVHLRLANHYGPYQKKGFVVADFASQIAEKEYKKDYSPIMTGNLEAMRDFLYIDDIVQAYMKIIEAERLRYSLYNIGNGSPVSVKYLLETLLAWSDISCGCVVDPVKFRSVDNPVIHLDSTRMKVELGWQPEISSKDGLGRTLAYWRSAVRKLK